MADKRSKLSVKKNNELQYIVRLNCTKANSDELVGLAVASTENPSGHAQVRILMDANVVSGVTVLSLQQVGGCD